MSRIENEKTELMTIETPDELKLIGTLAVRFHMINDEQLQQALLEQGRHEARSPVGQTLVEMGQITEAQLKFLRGAQEMKALRTRDIKFGSIAVKNGYVTEPQVDDVLQRQKQEYIQYKKKTLIGDILVADGTISEEQKESVIAEQNRIIQAREAYAQEQEPEELIAAAEKQISAGEGIELIVSKDGLLATLRAAPTIDLKELAQQVDKLINEYSITFGKASDESIAEWINAGKEREVRLELARGIAPNAGHGGEIQYHFDIDPLKAGKIQEGDVIDFKDRGELPQVEVGALVAEISKPDPGVAGTDVHGEVIPAPAVREKTLRCGKGTVFSADRSAVLADVEGTPSRAKSGAISVFPQYKVEGNVGYKTGHIDFDGDIQVSGTVEKDFKVRGGALTAKEIEAAEIVVSGDVVVSGGILGAHIKAGGNVMAAYIHNSTIEVEGDLLVQKEIMGCDIRTGGGVYSKSCIVLDSRIAARAGVMVRDVGSEVSAPSNIQVGSDALLEIQIAELNELVRKHGESQEELRKQLEQGDGDNQKINIDIAELAQIQDRSQVEQRELASQRDALVTLGEQQQAEEISKQIIDSGERAKKAEEDLNVLFERQDQIMENAPLLQQQIDDIGQQVNIAIQEIEVLQQQMEEEQADVYIKIVGTLYPMTTLSTAHTSVKTKKAMQAMLIKEKVQRTGAGDMVWKIVTESLG